MFSGARLQTWDRASPVGSEHLTRIPARPVTSQVFEAFKPSNCSPRFLLLSSIGNRDAIIRSLLMSVVSNRMETAIYAIYIIALL